MSDIKLFRLTSGKATALHGDASDLEKPLQTLIENNLETLLGIRFLATEYVTGKVHSGRIDTLGLDENACPVIIEYKRSIAENVINQGLFYLDWLMDHQAEFELLVMKTLGHEVAATIDWSAPRVVCIASDFTKYDSHAVQQMGRQIELVRYRLFGSDFLLLEAANTPNSKRTTSRSTSSTMTSTVKTRGADKTYAEWLLDLTPEIAELLVSVEDYILSIGDDVQRNELKLYVAFKRLKNFATIVPTKSRLLLYLHLDPSQLDPLPPFARDVRAIGHWGTGDMELSVSDNRVFDLAKPLIQMAYEGR